MCSNSDTKDLKILIIGNGIAGLSAADAARKVDNNAAITIISDESYLTYYRTRLCEFLKENNNDLSLCLHPETWYEERNINLILNNAVTWIDTDHKKVELKSGEKNSFDKLIIACGSRSYIPDLPGIDKNGVFTLRNIDNARSISNTLEHIENAIVVGGGLLGLESAYQLHKRGKRVTILEFFPRLLPNQLDKCGSDIFENKVKSLGIDVIPGVIVDSIHGDDQIQEVILNNDKSLEADFILFSTGIRPNTEIVSETGIVLNKGIVVDARMNTNFEDIYAAGDIAEYGGRTYGLWTVAMNQGKVAGINAAGGNVKYVPEVPPYFLNSMDTKVFSVGDVGNNPNHDYEIIEYIDGDNFVYQKLVMINNCLVGGILIGDVSNSAKINAAVKDKLSREEVSNLNLIKRK